MPDELIVTASSPVATESDALSEPCFSRAYDAPVPVFSSLPNNVTNSPLFRLTAHTAASGTMFGRSPARTSAMPLSVSGVAGSVTRKCLMPFSLAMTGKSESGVKERTGISQCRT